MNEEDKKKEVKYPVGEENLTIGGIKSFKDFEDGVSPGRPCGSQ